MKSDSASSIKQNLQNIDLSINTEKLDIAPDEEVSYFGYFDVSFRIDKYGKAKRVRFLSEGGEVTRSMEIRLNQYLQNVLFRPLFRDGKPYTDAISVRYYIAI